MAHTDQHTMKLRSAFALWHITQHFQKFLVIPGIISALSRETGRIDSRASAESIHFQPGASTAIPESSAIDGNPERRAACRALIMAFSTNDNPSSMASGIENCDCGKTSTASPDNSPCNSTSFLALPDARTIFFMPGSTSASGDKSPFLPAYSASALIKHHHHAPLSHNGG